MWGGIMSKKVKEVKKEEQVKKEEVKKPPKCK